MKRSFRNRLALPALGLLLSSVAGATSPRVPAAETGAAVRPAPARRALLIGINEYVTDTYPDLRGAVNDVATLREILIRHLGFEERHVTVLTDREATRSGILAALEQLVRTTGENDVVYFHFSGHGSQVEDLNGDEEDGKDETLLSHDARTAGVPDIVDDELAVFLARMRARTGVVTLDSCHSGTATRGTFVVRSAPPDTRLELYRKTRPTPRAIVPLDRPERYVLMTAAAAHQFALDGPADGRIHGFFSYALAQALQSTGAGATPNELHPRIRRTFDRFADKYGIPVPEPQIEATAARLESPLFGVPPAGATRAWAAVQTSDAGGAVLTRGRLLNADRGSYWAIYPPGESRFTAGEAIAVGTVTSHDADAAVLRIEPAGVRLPAGTRAVRISPGAPEELFVRLGGLSRERAAALRQTLVSRVPAVRFVPAGSFAHFEIDCDAAAGICLLRDGAGVTVLGRFVTDRLLSDGADAAQLAERFVRALNAATLLAITNPLSDLGLDVALVGGPQDLPRRVWRRGEALTAANSLVLEVRASRDCYLTIVDVDVEGAINVLFPTSHAEEGFLPGGFLAAGRTVRIPDSLARDNAAGFHWPFAGPLVPGGFEGKPAGLDTIQVFATRDRETAERIRARVASAGAAASRGARAPGSGHRGLRELRTELTSRLIRRRGAEPDRTRPEGDWTSVAVRVLIVE